MDGPSKLTAELMRWAGASRIQLKWMTGTLRLEDQSGVARAALGFPPGFWEAYESLTQGQQEQAIHAVVLRTQLMFDASWNGSFAKAIDVPISYVTGHED